MSIWDDFLGFAKSDAGKSALVGGGSLLLNSGLFSDFTSGEIPQTGYQGSIPEYTAVRETVPSTYDPNRRPGSGGQRYFTQTQYVPKSETPATPMSAEGLAALNVANPARQERSRPGGPRIPQPSTPAVNMQAKPPTSEGLPSVPTYENETVQMAAGGIATLKRASTLTARVTIWPTKSLQT